MFVEDNDQLNSKIQENEKASNLEKVYHQTVKKVTEDYEDLRFNTAISQFMVFINEAIKQPVSKSLMEGFVKLFAPVAPHLAEELWEKLGHTGTITYETWPAFDEAKLVDDEIEIVIQINGKVKTKLMVPIGTNKEQFKKLPWMKKVLKNKSKEKRFVKSFLFQVSWLILSQTKGF